MIFTIDGEPKGKQRHRYRVNWTRHFVQEYTPKETVDYEAQIMAEYLHAGGKLIDGPVKVEVWAFMKIPASTSKKKAKAMQGTPPTKKPDVDNILKVVMDGLKTAAYSDDKQVIEATVHKTYWDTPKVVIDVEEA